MLAQQELVFAKNQSLVGDLMPVMIERREPDGTYVARHQGQAPDIDSCVFVTGKQKLAAGEIVSVKVTDYQAYDLIAAVPAKKGRSLSVVRA